MVSPNKLYVLQLVDLVGGGSKIHDEVFVSEDAVEAYQSKLEYPLIGFVHPVTVNYS